MQGNYLRCSKNVVHRSTSDVWCCVDSLIVCQNIKRFRLFRCWSLDHAPWRLRGTLLLGVDQGCALDFFTDNELAEDDKARLSADAYTCRRNGRPLVGSSNFKSQSGSLQLNSSQSQRERTEGDEFRRLGRRPSEAVVANHEAMDRWSDGHVFIIREVIFETLARLAFDALRAVHPSRAIFDDRKRLAAMSSAVRHPNDKLVDNLSRANTGTPPQPPPSTLSSEDEETKEHQHPSQILSPSSGIQKRKATTMPPGGSTEIRISEGGEEIIKRRDGGTVLQEYDKLAATAANRGPLLFNEQYVVKPPHSSIEFGWHTVSGGLSLV